MDIAPPNQHPATSDDELAKVLAGIGANDSPNHPAPAGGGNAAAAGLQFEETPGPMPAGAANVNTPSLAPSDPMPASTLPTAPVPEPSIPMAVPSAAPTLPAAGGLDQLKKTALEELRPLV